jgi:hypothetical protein
MMPRKQDSQRWDSHLPKERFANLLNKLQESFLCSFYQEKLQSPQIQSVQSLPTALIQESLKLLASFLLQLLLFHLN